MAVILSSDVSVVGAAGVASQDGGSGVMEGGRVDGVDGRGRGRGGGVARIRLGRVVGSSSTGV